MNKFMMLCAAVLMLMPSASAQSRKQRAEDEKTKCWDYEVETKGKNSRGEYILKVWNYSKDANLAAEQGKKNAVHAVVFKGTPASDNNRVPGIKALVPDISAQENEFFDSFFAEGGDYKRFVTVSNNGFTEVVKIPKVKKNGKDGPVYKFKVGLTVTINIPALRKYLEEAGIVKSLNAGFN